MSEHPEIPARRTRLMTRIHARMAGMSGRATGFVSQPEPRSMGLFARGRQLVAGNFLFAGFLVEASDISMWDLPVPDVAFEEELHGFVWLDDLAAVGDGDARIRAQDWTYGWITKYGKGRGPGWTPDLTGRRVIRWVNHAIFLLNARDRAASEAFYRALTAQVVFLSRRWSKTSQGLPRFEALTGLIYAGLSLTGMDAYVRPAVIALGRECAATIDERGGVATRNPEELLEIFTLLNWAALALDEAGQRPEQAHLDAIERIAPTLRCLRHSDGSLARFHGGGRGLEGRLDQALATSGIKVAPMVPLPMGYARVSAGRTTIIVDAAPPPSGTVSYNGHASTLAFELTSGRRPVIVNCGSGATFGHAWRRAGRATASHSTLSLEGYSSARLGEATLMAGIKRELLVDVPIEVNSERDSVADGIRLQVSHDGYRRTHGLTHARTLELTNDGRGVAGEDMVMTLDDADTLRFDRVMDKIALQGVAFSVRFHLHPDIDATIDMGGTAVSLVLKSGEIWVFRHDAQATLTLEASVYLEKGRLKPRGAQQIVLSARALQTITRVRWSLAKAHETPLSVRDFKRDDPLNPPED